MVPGKDSTQIWNTDRSNTTKGKTLLYATDTVFQTMEGQVYYIDAVSDKYWERYLETFDRIIVVGRRDRPHIEVNSYSEESESSSRLEFKLFPNLSTLAGMVFKRGKSRCQIADLIKSVDVVLGRLHSELGLIAVTEAKRLGKVWAVEMTSCAFDCLWNYGDIRAKLYAPIMYWRTHNVVSSAPVAIYVTQSFLQGRYPSRKGQSYAVSDVELPAPSHKVLARRVRKIASNESYRLGIIASLRPDYKGIETILRALQVWPTDEPKIELHILGPGSTNRWKEKARIMGIEEIVVFSKSVPPGEAVVMWLDKIDIYLQPSLAEGLPRALIEAMSRGCPAIASNVGGIPELLNTDNLIVPGDYRTLRQKLLQGVRDKEWQAMEAERNWRKAGEYAFSRLENTRREALRKCVSLIPK